MYFSGFFMPNQIGSDSSAAAGVHVNSSDKAGSSAKSYGTKMTQAAQLLGSQLKRTMATITKFSKSETGQAKAPKPSEEKAGLRNAGPLKEALQHLNRSNNTMVLRKVDSELPVTKQLKALRGMSSVDRLKAIVSQSPWSESGAVNMSFIEHFCGLRDDASKLSPDVNPQPTEGHTVAIASYCDFTLGVIHNEIQLIDSMLNDIHRNDVVHGVRQQTFNAMETVSGVLQKSGNLMSKISRHALFNVASNDPNAVSNAAFGCLGAVKQLPPGGKLLIPLIFFSMETGNANSAGHATYMVVEKNRNNSVNLHMVNRGAGSEAHRSKPGEVAVPGQHPKTESAVSKWNVPIEATGGFSHNFLVKTLLLTLDAQAGPNGRGIVESFHADPSRQLSANIAKFYQHFAMRTGTEPPLGHEPIYQRPQKDGNCAYSNLKASIRYLLDDSKMYNQIDLLKTEKVAKLTLKYMKENLLQNPTANTALLNRFQFNAEGAVEKLVAKHEKANHRINLDNGAAMPLDLPDHLWNVTN